MFTVKFLQPTIFISAQNDYRATPTWFMRNIPISGNAIAPMINDPIPTTKTKLPFQEMRSRDYIPRMIVMTNQTP